VGGYGQADLELPRQGMTIASFWYSAPPNARTCRAKRVGVVPAGRLYGSGSAALVARSPGTPFCSNGSNAARAEVSRIYAGIGPIATNAVQWRLTAA
jgi:hypothetical protein